MYRTLKAVIESGRFELSDMLTKIDTFWVQNDITEEQKIELVALAREKATPENSYVGIQKQIANLYLNLTELTQRIVLLETEIKALKGETPEDTEDEESVVEEYPEYVAPTGAHDAYYAGAKVTYNGIRYICIAPEGVAVVWTPEVYPAYWQEVVEVEDGTEELQ